MYMNFSINKTISLNVPLIIHNCNEYKKCDLQTCKEINEIAKIRYIGIIFLYYILLYYIYIIFFLT
jgi:hypothetical protein